MLIIDCHAHIYSDDEKQYPPIEKPFRPPQGTGTVAHLRREMKANGVRSATAIQTSTFYRWDNRFTTDAARAHDDHGSACQHVPGIRDRPSQRPLVPRRPATLSREHRTPRSRAP